MNTTFALALLALFSSAIFANPMPAAGAGPQNPAASPASPDPTGGLINPDLTTAPQAQGQQLQPTAIRPNPS
ncbi:MAG: hypothetical protein QW275_02710, partial [Candidatus Anstonellaceae archaeon]